MWNPEKTLIIQPKEDNEFLKRGEWKTKQYWALPENARRAIDKAKEKQNQTDFQKWLEVLNDKVQIYNQVFYHKLPNYQKKYLEK